MVISFLNKCVIEYHLFLFFYLYFSVNNQWMPLACLSVVSLK